MLNMQSQQQSQQSLEQSVIRRLNKEIQQEQLNKESRIILIPPTNENYHNLRAFYIVQEHYFKNSNLNMHQDALSSQSQQEEVNIDQQCPNYNDKYIYNNCVLEVNIIIPKTYPLSNPRFKFPQQPLHPSFKNGAICCGISCQFKKNWDPTQTIFTGIDTFCRSILSIPSILMNKKKIDLTRDCNFEIVSQINNDKQQFLDKCSKWAVSKGNLLNFVNDQEFCQYLNKNQNHPLVIEVLDRIQKIKDRRMAHQLIMLENNQSLFKSLSISMIQQMMELTKKPDLLPMSKQNNIKEEQ